MVKVRGYSIEMGAVQKVPPAPPTPQDTLVENDEIHYFR
jgi:hypothetical protein